MSDDKQLAQELKELKQRLQVIEDKEAIRELMVQYSFNADLDRTDGFVNLWTEDAVFDVGDEFGGVYKGKDRIRQLMDGPVHKSITNYSQHLMLDFKIDVDGDTATAAGYVLVTLNQKGEFGMFRCAFRTFRFRRVEGRWLIEEAVSRATGDPRCQTMIPADL